MKTTDFPQRLGVISSREEITCPFFKSEPETRNQMLLLCPGVWRLWSELLDWWGICGATPASVEGLLQWWMGVDLKKMEHLIWKSLPIALL